MNKKSSVLKDTLIYGAGNFASKVLGFLLLPFYTTILNTSDYGYVDLITTGAVLFTTIASAKTFDAAYRFLWSADTDDARQQIVSTALNFTLIAGLLIAAIGYGTSLAFAASLPYMALVVGMLTLRIPAEYLQQIARSAGRKEVYSIAGIILSVATILSNVYFLWYLELGLQGYLISCIVAYGLSLAYCALADSGAKYYRPGVIDKELLKKMLQYSLPLIPAAVSWWIIRGSGRFILSSSHGMHETGIFAVSDKLPTVVYMFNMTFYMAWQDAILKHYHESNSSGFINSLLNNYITIAGSAIIFITLCLKPFFRFMIGPEYQEAIDYVPPLLLGVLVLCIGGLYDVFFMATNKTSRLILSTVAASVVSLLINYLLVERFSIWATVLSTVASAALMLAIRHYQLRREFSPSFNIKNILVLLSLFALAWWTVNASRELAVALTAVVLVGLTVLNYPQFALITSKLRKFAR